MMRIIKIIIAIFFIAIFFISCNDEKTYSEREYRDYGNSRYEKGKSEGFEEGQKEGFEEGKKAAENENYDDGYEAGRKKGREEGFLQAQSGKKSHEEIDKYHEKRKDNLMYVGITSLAVFIGICLFAITYIIKTTEFSLRIANFLAIALAILFGTFLSSVDLTFIKINYIAGKLSKLLTLASGTIGTFLFFLAIGYFSQRRNKYSLSIVSTVFMLTLNIIIIAILFLNYEILIEGNEFLFWLSPSIAFGGIIYSIHFFLQTNNQSSIK